MDNKEKIYELIYQVVDEVNAKLPKGQKIDKKENAVWLGPSSSLDSLGITFLIMGVTEKVKEVLGVEISIEDEKIISFDESPFRSSGALAEYISSLGDAQ